MENKNMEQEKVEVPAVSGIPAVEEKKPEVMNKNLKMFLYGFGGLLVVAIVAVLVTATVRVYRYTKTDGFTVGVARIMRLPVMKVNGDRVLYSDYADDMKAIGKMKVYDAASGGPSASMTDEVMSDQVLWRLTNNILIEKMGTEYGVTVESKDIDTIKEQILTQFKTTEEANKELSSRYGWTLDTYTEKVIRPFVLHQKLSEKIGVDQKAREDVRAQAQKVLEEIKAGADFAGAAKKYGQDGTAANGGDLGWFAKGDMVPEFENAAFALKKGEITKELVETEYGYHIIKLVDKKTEKVKDETTSKMVNTEQAQASHILFAFPSADKYLDEMAKKAVIKLYVNVHNPFEILQAPLAEAK